MHMLILDHYRCECTARLQCRHTAIINHLSIVLIVIVTLQHTNTHKYI